MKIKQLSLFLENKPGRLTSPCRVLSQAGLNIVTLSLADTQQFGILRLIVRDWQKAQAALQQAGFVVNATDVVAVDIADRPGGLLDLLDILERGNINIEYMYAFTVRKGDSAIMVFRFEDPEAAIRLLQSSGKDVIKGSELLA